jgi:hypothetical protein
VVLLSDLTNKDRLGVIRRRSTSRPAGDPRLLGKSCNWEPASLCRLPDSGRLATQAPKSKVWPTGLEYRIQHANASLAHEIGSNEPCKLHRQPAQTKAASYWLAAFIRIRQENSRRPRRTYLMISEIVPAPTVRPPSRIAKRRPFSIATGVCSVISSPMLSPGITISVPSGSFAEPVTSVVRK